MRVILLVAVATGLIACADGKTSTSPRDGGSQAPFGTHKESVVVAPHNDSLPLGDRIDALLGGSLRRVSIPPDSASQSPDAVHPDIACPPSGWNGASCWLMYTPYKNSNALYENPGLLIASSDTLWTTPPAVVNPLVPSPGSGSYNSDPDHAFDPLTHRLIQVYRVVSGGYNNIMLMSTGDARNWTPAVLAWQVPNHDAVSPALVIAPDRTARIWDVRSGDAGCTATSSTVELRTAQPDSATPFENATWSEPITVDMSVPGAVVWHLDVVAMPNGAGYLALIVAFPRGLACGNSDLWIATSPDGLRWKTFQAPAFWRAMKSATTRSVTSWYRGTLRYNAATDEMDLWPSALSGSTWLVYHTRVKLADLVALLDKAAPAEVRALNLNRATALRAVEMP